jgi:hypothetical protein
MGPAASLSDLLARNDVAEVQRATAVREMVEMGESRTPRPEAFSGDHYERVR